MTKQSIATRYNEITQGNSSSYIRFARAIENRNYTSKEISHAFHLVDTDDYAQSDKEALLTALYAHSKSRTQYPKDTVS